MTACIVGWAHSPFGKLAGETVESLIVKVAGGALADAGISAKDVDEIVLGHFNAGFSAQDFTAALVLQASNDLRFKRAHSLSDRANTSVHFLDLNHRLACAQFASQISARLLAPLLYCPSKIVGQATARGSGLHLHIGSAR